jgi:ribonuclease HII
VQVDGNRCPRIELPCEAIVKGDSLVAAISAASILAKTARDALLVDLDLRYPHYGLAQHKGYPTAAHLAALKIHGACDIYRKSFGPVRDILAHPPQPTQELF